MRLLLLEDDSRLRALIAAWLQEAGHSAEQAASTHEGLNLALVGGLTP